MEITLEKIELVKDRTGVSYKEAKDALEAADGNVVDAIINIEEEIDEAGRTKFTAYAKTIVETLKGIVKKGNVSKILIKKDGEIVMNIPVTIGVLGTVIAPFAAVAGIVAAFGTKCVIEVIKDDGSVIDVNGIASGAKDEIALKSSGIREEMKAKGAELYDTVKEKGADAYEAVKEKAADVIRRDGEDDEYCDEDDDCSCEFDDEDDVTVDSDDSCACCECDEKDCENCEIKE